MLQALTPGTGFRCWLRRLQAEPYVSCLLILGCGWQQSNFPRFIAQLGAIRPLLWALSTVALGHSATLRCDLQPVCSAQYQSLETMWAWDPNFLREQILVSPVQLRHLKSILTFHSTCVLERWLLDKTLTRTELVLPWECPVEEHSLLPCSDACP